MNFNTDPQLFINLRNVNCKLDACLRSCVQVIDGHVVQHRNDVIARFTDNDHAASVLTAAGWLPAGGNYWAPDTIAQRRMLEEQAPEPVLPTVIDAQNMSPHMARYWHALAKKMTGRVSAIDPWRIALATLRQQHPELRGRRIYRASTGGRWGKSAQIVTV